MAESLGVGTSDYFPLPVLSNLNCAGPVHDATVSLSLYVCHSCCV